MPIVQEVKQVIESLPIHKATIVKYWLDEFVAARHYKKIKAYSLGFQALAKFRKSNGNALWN